jgi:hypothetical protein
MLGLSEAQAQRLMNSVSTPIYKAAVAQTVGKYNRTEAPAVMQRVRKALSLTDGAAQQVRRDRDLHSISATFTYDGGHFPQVHHSLYDANLGSLLPEQSKGEGSPPKLTEETMALLGELEGILQVRSPLRRLQSRTVPLYRAHVRATLKRALQACVDDGDKVSTSNNPLSVWGQLALRQQDLRLPTEAIATVLVDESRRLAASVLGSAAEAQRRGELESAGNTLRGLLRFGAFLGELYETAGFDSGDERAAALVERHLGALPVPPDCKDTANELRSLAARGGELEASASDLLLSMLALVAPEFDGPRASYAGAVERALAAGKYDGAARVSLERAARENGVPRALASVLGLNGYYGWLVMRRELLLGVALGEQDLRL